MWTIGSWYEEGLAAGRALGEFIRGRAGHVLKSYLGWLPGKSREEIGRLLTEYNRKRLEATPDLAKFPELRGMRELIEAERRGIREGAGLDDVLAAVHFDGQTYFHREIAGKAQGAPKAHCSVAYFATSDHGPLLASNLDTDIHEPYAPPGWPLLNEHLIFGGVSSGVFLDESSPEIFPVPVFKLIARYCRSAPEAVEMLDRYRLFAGPGNLIIIDRDHRIAMIEKTACRMGVRWADGFGFITAMTQEDPAMKAFVSERRAASLVARGLPNPCADTRYWDAQDVRREIMNRLTADARSDPTLEKMRALMQYRGPDGVVADNGDILAPGDPPIEHTIKMQIICLAEARALWWTRDNARNIPSWENRREDVTFTDVLAWN
ncbi:MAG: hypothetical protein K8S99_06620 [Planctomycetes bacterium]|nr:hypothetical protein [Planctomycetota bacterium]